jgi:hypothetical protein
MNDKDFQILLVEAHEKVNRAFFLVKSSIDKNLVYKLDQSYTPEELEPFDALSDRFIRCIETFIKFFKTYDRYESIASALTYRDLMNIMAKLELISGVEIWINMRDVRNKIVHDYLPEQIKGMFDLIRGEFAQEIEYSKKKIDALIQAKCFE